MALYNLVLSLEIGQEGLSLRFLQFSQKLVIKGYDEHAVQVIFMV